jgi:hypothetical protein
MAGQDKDIRINQGNRGEWCPELAESRRKITRPMFDLSETIGSLGEKDFQFEQAGQAQRRRAA